MELIIDKSFLDAASPKEISHIWETHFVIIPDILFYELMTTREESREHCFGKLPDIDSPMALLPGIGELLRYEIGTKRSCVPLSERCLKQEYGFNTRPRKGTFEFMDEVLQEKNTQTAQIGEDTKNFVETCMTVHQFFPEMAGITYSKLPCAVDAAMKRVACDTDFVKMIYESFLKEQGSDSGWPSPDQIEDNWAFFRWVQCQLIASLRLFRIYQAGIPPNPGNKFWTKAEHSMLDTYYLIFATLGGALASADRPVMEDFSLICPNGILISPVGQTLGKRKKKSGLSPDADKRITGE